MKRSLAVVAALVAAAVFAGQAAAGSNVGITIRHQKVGCHAWAIGNGAYKATQSVTVSAGTTLTFSNHDLMPHRLIELSGAHVAMRNLAPTMPMGMGMRGPFAAGMMGRMGAATELTLVKPGMYVFGTKPGEDYTKGIVTVGDDNVLRLIVTVK
jgi:plastocyanin